MDTTTPTVYTVSPDAHGDPTLWRGTAADPYAHAVAMKCELDRLDPVLWPTLVAALVSAAAATPDPTVGMSEIRQTFAARGKIAAIRQLREITGVGLREAKLAVERICKDLTPRQSAPAEPVVEDAPPPRVVPDYHPTDVGKRGGAAMTSIPGLHGDTRRLALRAAGRNEVTASIGGQVLTVDAGELQALLDGALEDCAAYEDGPEGIEWQDAAGAEHDRG